MRKIIILLTAITLCVALGVNVFAASAACANHIDPGDYISSVSVSNNTKTVTYSLPLNESFQVGSSKGVHINEPFSFMRDTRFESWGVSGETNFLVFPLGYGNSVSVADLQQGSVLEFRCVVELEGHQSNDPISPLDVDVFPVWFFYDNDCNQITYDYISSIDIEMTYYETGYGFTWNVEVPQNAVYIFPRLTLTFDVDTVDAITLTTTAFEVTHDIDMLLDNSNTLHRVEEAIEGVNDRLDDINGSLGDINGSLGDINSSIQEGNNKLDNIQGSIDIGNEKLDDIKEGINGTNDRLDEITDYIPVPDGPEGGEVADNYVNAEDELMDEIQGGLDEVGKVQNEALTSFVSYLSAVVVMTGLLDLIIEGTVMRSVLVFSLALGTCGFILNLGVKLASSGGSRSKGGHS